MRYLFIDRVTSLVYRERIAAVVAFAPDDPIFQWHFPGRPVVPASQLVEAFAQAGTILVETSLAFTRKAMPGFLRGAKFHRAVGPGPLEIEMIVEQWSGEAAVLHGLARQHDARCATCTIGIVTAPFEAFVPRGRAAPYRGIYERWLDAAVLSGFDAHPLASFEHAGA